VNILSTDGLNARDRFDYWRNTICDALFQISIDTPPERFSARIAARSSGPLRFARSESTEYRIARSRHDIARTDTDHYSIYLQISGKAVFVENEQETTLDAGDISLCEGRVPFHGTLSGSRAIAVVPKAMLDGRAPWLRKVRRTKLKTSSTIGDLAKRYLLQLNAADLALSDSETSVLVENLCNLVALASAADIEPRRLQPEVQIEAVLAVCRQRLGDPDLSPGSVAARLGISVRTLHARFQQMGLSFGRWVLEARLEACRRALQDRSQKAINVAEVAFHHGFNDLSYFYKVFRARFGMTPRECRGEMAVD
jgi:AraC family transcriptional activator of tynA and feaB